MTGLKDGLSQLADEAKTYGNLDRAVTTARRRRRTALVGGIAVAAVLVGGGGATAALTGAVGPRTPGITAADATHTVQVPNATPAALPADRGVGKGAAIYIAQSKPSGAAQPARTADGKPNVWVYTTDGHWYLVPGAVTGVPVGTGMPGLSPDGQWLAYRVDGKPMVRDLSGTTVWRNLPEGIDNILRGWSPDGHWLVVQKIDEPKYIRLDLRTGALQTMDVSKLGGTPPADNNADYMVEVRNNGDLLVPVATRASGSLRWAIAAVDPVSGRVKSRVSLPADLQFGPDANGSLLPGWDGTSVLLTADVNQRAGRPQHIGMMLDMNSGHRTPTGLAVETNVNYWGKDGILITAVDGSKHLTEAVLIDPSNGQKKVLVRYLLPNDVPSNEGLILPGSAG